MKTRQRIIIDDSRKLDTIPNHSIDLIITSPPYPMIKMWDEQFCTLNHRLNQSLIENDPHTAFSYMHEVLNEVYCAAINKLKEDGTIIINIANATRHTKRDFELFDNVAQTVLFFNQHGFSQLPPITWKKCTNAPNKFLGSGCLPINCYNTLEHESILIFRKKKRVFKNDTLNRYRSAFFNNERNIWCADTWTINGTKQVNPNEARKRSGAFPLSIPYRLIAMWSVMGDQVLDLFGGTGTTLLACAALARNGTVVEIEPAFLQPIIQRLLTSKNDLNDYNQNRIEQYKIYLSSHLKNTEYYNKFLNLKVISKQETHLIIPHLIDIKQFDQQTIEITYDD